MIEEHIEEHAILGVKSQNIFDSRYVNIDGDTMTGDLSLGNNDLLDVNSLEMLQAATNAILIGDITGNTRGDYAIDISSGRTQVFQVAVGDYSIAAGYGAAADDYSIAVGSSARAGSDGTALGYSAIANSLGSVAIGRGSVIIDGIYGVAVGYSTSVSAEYGVAIGDGASATGTKAIAIGNQPIASGNYATVIGYNIENATNYSVLFGDSYTGNYLLLTADLADFSGGANFLNGKILIASFQAAGAWIDIPAVLGSSSGIGSGGAGTDAWLGYTGNDGDWFSDSLIGDICYRNTGGRILMGVTGANSDVVIDDSSVTIGAGIQNTNPTINFNTYWHTYYGIPQPSLYYDDISDEYLGYLRTILNTNFNINDLASGGSGLGGNIVFGAGTGYDGYISYDGFDLFLNPYYNLDTSTFGRLFLGGGAFVYDTAAGGSISMGYPTLAETGYMVKINEDAALIRSYDASSGTTLVNSKVLYLQGAYWSGGVSNKVTMRIFNVLDSVTPTYHLSFKNTGGTEIMALGDARNLKIIGNLDHDGSNIGFFGTTPTTKQTHIIDADGTLADITTKFNALLLKMENYGLLAAS